MSIPEFGIKREKEERRDGGCAVIFDPDTQQYAVGERSDNGLLILFGGGADDGESIQDCVVREVCEESGLHDFMYSELIAEANTHYHNIAKKVNRAAHATCLLLILKTADALPVALEEHEKFSLAWKSAEEIIGNWERRNKHEDYSHWIYFMKKGAKKAIRLGYDTTTDPALVQVA